MRKRFFKRSEWMTEIEVDGAECHDRADNSSHDPIDDFISSHSASNLFASEERPDGPAKCDIGTLPRKQQGNTFTLCGLNHRKFRVCLCQPNVSSHYKEIVCGVLSIAQKSGPPLGIFPQPIIRKPCLLKNGKYFSLNTST